MPNGAGPLVVLFHACLVASALCLVGVRLTGDGQVRAELLRPRPISLALSVCGPVIEVGVLLMYRGGRPADRAALISTALATAVLFPIGNWFFDEALPPLKVAGLVACLAGLILLCW